jgi:uncharacterized protein YdeI (YjbR/CyaY-like superfamily)
MRDAKTADEYFAKADRWRQELRALRAILKSAGLTEEVKWGGPCYTAHGANVVGLGAFKSYFGLWFFQGALLKDPKGVLVNAQEGRTKALRQWRMHSREDIDAKALKLYIEEAIALAREGRTVEKAAPKPLRVPRALAEALAADKRASAAFKSMTPGKQREYADYVAGAKREDTRQKRIVKVLPMIASGAGLNDKYRRNC